MKTYGYKRGQDWYLEPWMNPKDQLKTKKCERQAAKIYIEEEIAEMHSNTDDVTVQE